MDQLQQQGLGSIGPLVAQRMVELIHDLGECGDGRQVLVTTLRHFRFLFGDYKGFMILMSDETSTRWRCMVIDNPYGQSGGGLNSAKIPEGTDVDSITMEFGQDATAWVAHDLPLVRAFVESHEPVLASASVLQVRLAMFSGLMADQFWAAKWCRPDGAKAWCVLGFDEEASPDESMLPLFATAVETVSRMSFYPSLLQRVARSERINHSLRRNMVHDLKTPITVIKGYAETLALDGVKDDDEMFVEMIGGVIESCDRLLADIKDIIEPIEGVWEPSYEEFDLARMVHKVAVAERHTERSRTHTIEIEGCGEPVLVMADRRKLMRVTENLLSNAVKYSPGAGKTVWVRVRQAGDLVAIEIQDQGLGLTADQRERVLTDCERVVDQSLGIEGSGFGLNSCQLVLRAHGGQLQVESEAGVGSVFRAVIRRAPTK
jgi:signal transduction histidine kinase